MISELDLKTRVHVATDIHDGDVDYVVLRDGKQIFRTESKQSAYHRANEERNKMSLDELFYDNDLRVRPERRRKVREQITMRNPKIGDFPYSWKVFYGDRLIGSFISQWEAIQFRDRVIMDGGFY